MAPLHDQHSSLAGTGLQIPPILFGTASLGNVGRVITEQAKVAICGDWFRGVKSPVFVHTSYNYGKGVALEVIGRTLRRLEISGQEIIIQLAIDSEVASVKETWEKSCWLLGTEYRPKLLSLENPDDATWQAAVALKAANVVQGVGITVADWKLTTSRLVSLEPDWVTLGGGCTVMQHAPEMLEFMTELAGQQIPIIVAGVFDGGFLVGSNRLNGRLLSPDDPSQRSLFVWRKAFVALCDGYSISPAHACIQFALSLPGVAAVRLDSSYPDRVAENIRSAYSEVPPGFWESLKEEGLLKEIAPGC
jgi:D-threo-aldose 1-dehydrogenase